ncbi:MAG: T9SS type A sorting domain-containing protein [Bacteroidota bacterium]
MKTLTIFFAFIHFFYLTVYAQQSSRILYEADNGCLTYVTDQNHNYIPDYSYAGYRYGEEALPFVPTVKTIQPIAGDNTAHIQAALDEVAQMTADSNGIRGALLLEAGIYRINGSVTVGESGVVLRGVGQETDTVTNTILIATGTDTRNLVCVGHAPNVNNSWTNRLMNTTTLVTSEFLPAGVRTIAVEDPSLYEIGDHIMIKHVSTNEWLATINFGDTDSDDPWRFGEIDLYYNRIITAIELEEKKLMLDVPIYDHLERSLSQAQVYKYDRSAIKTKVGVENLRIIIETAGEEDENHARSAIVLNGTEDSWVRDVTALHFTYAGVDIYRSNRITIKDCRAIEPHSMVTGGRRYNFAVGRLTNNILFDNCFANLGRHAYVSNGASQAAGIVFYNCRSDQDLSTIEGHRRWSQALLYDNLIATNPQTTRVLGLYNRGRFGTGHGWAAVHSMAWNVRIEDNKAMVIQRPPERQNYSIGAKANFNVSAPFSHPNGWIELTQQQLVIPSLYEKQLEARLKNGALLDAPAKLMAAVLEDNRVELNWLDISSEEQQYRIEFKDSEAEAFQVLAILPANTTRFVHELNESEFPPLTYRVQAVDEVCYSPFSNPVSIEMTTAIEEISLEDSLVLPNPFSDELLIESDVSFSAIKVYTIDGKLIFSSQKQLNTIATTEWTRGVYILKLMNGEQLIGVQKVVKE